MKAILRRIINKTLLLRRLNAYRLQKKQEKQASQDPRINANRVYRSVFKKNINWDNPQNLIEKIYWLQLFTDTTLWTKCADKYRMREYVKSKNLEILLPKLYGHWERGEEIDFAALPQSFVLKTTNGCGQVLLVKDKSELDIPSTIKLLNEWMTLKYGFTDAQIHYSRIKTCIIAEEYLTIKNQKENSSLIDYKVWCFHGKPEYILVVYDRIILGENRGYSLSAYDLEWNDISGRALKKNNPHYCGKHVSRPERLQDMLDYARILSEDFAEVRVDFYETDGRLSLGELTFTTGYGSHSDEFYDYLGSKIDLSKVQRIERINRPIIER